jgi:hypothetical protein
VENSRSAAGAITRWIAAPPAVVYLLSNQGYTVAAKRRCPVEPCYGSSS